LAPKLGHIQTFLNADTWISTGLKEFEKSRSNVKEIDQPEVVCDVLERFSFFVVLFQIKNSSILPATFTISSYYSSKVLYNL
jgi:hypothetical protein